MVLFRNFEYVRDLTHGILCVCWVPYLNSVWNCEEDWREQVQQYIASHGFTFESNSANRGIWIYASTIFNVCMGKLSNFYTKWSASAEDRAIIARLNPVHVLIRYFYKINFCIILLFTLASTKRSLSIFPTKCTCFGFDERQQSSRFAQLQIFPYGLVMTTRCF